ncbi:mucin-2-like [Macrobrachium nipponense]|uniref:mucin-2-like n=1 Tax=Macrobrachium nipponense TaxID=159736 RepID=UPI0030C89A4C
MFDVVRVMVRAGTKRIKLNAVVCNHVNTSIYTPGLHNLYLRLQERGVKLADKNTESDTLSDIEPLSLNQSCLINTSVLDEYVKLGFIEEVKLEENSFDPVDGINYYLPHHPVFKESATTPIRIVFNASSKESHHAKSVNDCLPAGPSLATKLTDMLLEFRQNKYAVVADIKLNTIVAEAENIINNRPLTYVNEDNADTPLTPAKLLYGRTITMAPPLNKFVDVPFNENVELRENYARLSEFTSTAAPTTTPALTTTQAPFTTPAPATTTASATSTTDTTTTSPTPITETPTLTNLTPITTNTITTTPTPVTTTQTPITTTATTTITTATPLTTPTTTPTTTTTTPTPITTETPITTNPTPTTTTTPMPVTTTETPITTTPTTTTTTATPITTPPTTTPTTTTTTATPITTPPTTTTTTATPITTPPTTTPTTTTTTPTPIQQLKLQ